MSDARLAPAALATPTGGAHTSPEDLVLSAMQLVPADEGEVINRHVAQCTACREELGRVYGDLAALALTAGPATPNAAARDRLLAQVARETRIVARPTTKTAAQPAPKPRPVPIPDPAPRPLADFGRGKGSTLVPEPLEVAPPRPPVPSWMGWAVAAVFLVAIAFLYNSRQTLKEGFTTQSGEMQRLNARAAGSHQLMDALTDPQALRATLTPRTPLRGPIGGVIYDPKKGSLVFLASNLDPIQTYKTYELWVIPADGSAPIAAGTFHPDEHGNASVIMPNMQTGVDAKSFRVTIEDAGGSDKPSLPIILSGR